MKTNVYELAVLISKLAHSNSCINCKFKRNCNQDCLLTMCNLLVDENKCKEMFINENNVVEHVIYLLQIALEHVQNEMEKFRFVRPYNYDMVDEYATKKLNQFLFTKMLGSHSIIIDTTILQVKCEWSEQKEQIFLILLNRKEFLEHIEDLTTKETLKFENFNVISHKYDNYKKIPIIINEGE